MLPEMLPIVKRAAFILLLHSVARVTWPAAAATALIVMAGNIHGHTGGLDHHIHCILLPTIVAVAACKLYAACKLCADLRRRTWAQLGAAQMRGKAKLTKKLHRCQCFVRV